MRVRKPGRDNKHWETVCLFSPLAQHKEPKGCMWETVRFTRKMNKELKLLVQRSDQLGVHQLEHVSLA